MAKKKLVPNRPYAKLADCAGQRFVGGSLHGKQHAILAFENAWCWVSAFNSEDEGPCLSEREFSVDHGWAEQEAMVSLGLLTREEVERHRADAARENDESRERHERETYERLKKKFEGS